MVISIGHDKLTNLDSHVSQDGKNRPGKRVTEKSKKKMFTVIFVNDLFHLYRV